MKRRKHRYRGYSKRTIILTIALFCSLFFGLGYSLLGTSLGLTGNVEVSKYDQTLYGVLKKEARKGIYAQTYTGAHQDSMNASLSTEKIYHWYAPNTTDGDSLAAEILDKNNVIFANHCWQMIRTTDTGGVKMIYNGEPENGKCLNTRGNHVGYSSRTTQSLSSSYYYGTSYTYDSINNVFQLDGTVTTGAINQGEYTCKSTSSSGTCATLYLVDTLSSGSTYYVLQLNGNSHYSQFGTLQFNVDCYSPADVGYMYNTKYNHNQTDTPIEYMFSKDSLKTTYWYADSITWNSSSNRYELNNPYQVSSVDDYPNLVGKYTFESEIQSYTSSNAYYIAVVDNTTMYNIYLPSNRTLADVNHNYTYGDSYTDNGNGTYTINNPTTINRSNWYTSYSSIATGKYVCKNAVNDTCSEVWYTESLSNSYMFYLKVSNIIKYANGFTYDDNTNTYTLNSDSVSFWNTVDSTNQTSINNHHYTCWNESGECATISYVYFVRSSSQYYINITEGKGIGDALNEMFTDNDVNAINSTIKTGVDAWYKRYMSEYTSKLEDIIFCTDRSQKNASTNGWNPNGGSVSIEMSFYGSSGLSCSNATDRFSMTNTRAQLTYPVGLITFKEMEILNNRYIRRTGKSYWLGSPDRFNWSVNAFERNIESSGDYTYASLVVNTYGVRPVISLKPGTEYVFGTGSMADPYIVA